MSDPNAEGNDGFVSEMDIRIVLRDKDPEANKLLGDFEWSHEEIRTAMTLAVDRFNETPPQVGHYTIRNFPWRYYFIMGTSANLFTIAAASYRRNRLNYNIPGGSIDDQDKRGEYESAAERMSKEYGEWIRRAKLEINMNKCWGQDGTLDYFVSTDGI